jgi:hypothetical protein
MANFSKILGLASSALVFAGMAFGQNCTGGTAQQTPLVRAEGTEELVGEYQFSCTTGGTINILDILSLPVTSKVLSTSGATSGQTEAVAVVSNPAAVVFGTVSGSQVTFSNVTVNAGGTVTIANIRVNASTLPASNGAPTPITESAFVSGTGVQASVTMTANVGFALNGLAAQTVYKAVATPGNPNANPATAGSLGTSGLNRSAFLVCTGYSATGTAPLIGAINVKEGFPTAFKAAGSAATNNTLGSEFTNNTETGFGVTLGTTSNTATTATMIQIAFNNIASGATIYVPTTVTDINGTNGTLTLVTSPSNTAAVTASTSTSAVAGTAALTAANGSATAYYLFAPGAGTTNNNTQTYPASNAAADSFSIPVYSNSSANTVAATSTALTASVSLAPIGSTQIPNFVVGPSTSTLTLNTFAACTTSLLFPFVTNQLGFDTGIAIANTSTDPFGSKGATAQAGTCTLNFYGSGAPSPNNVATANIPTGTVYTGVLSGLAAGFQGYIIAQCNFQYAHGFAFITDGVGPNGGLSQGYLAGVIPDVNQQNRAAGVGETLGN